MHGQFTNADARAQASPLAIALGYIKRGWNVLPLPYRKKAPKDEGWQRRTITQENAHQFFGDAPQNIGVQLGPKSGGLTDVDLDCAEAIEIASAVLPKTHAIFGRASKRHSHYLYNTSLASTSERGSLPFKDPESKGMLLELRIGGGDKGAQTVFPGSVHQCGEPIKWETEGEPTQVDPDELLRRAGQLGALCLLARYWPRKPEPGESGGRHDAALTIGGFLARCGFKPSEVKLCAEWIARGARDEEWRDRIKAAHDAALAYKKGDKTRGYPKLKETFGEKVASKVAEWLRYSGPSDDDARASERASDDSAAKTNEEATQGASLPTIEVRGGELSNLASRGEEVLSAAGAQIFQRSRQLVRPVVEEVDATRGRKTKICQLIPIVPDYLRDLLCRHARWEILAGKKHVTIDPPRGIAATMLARTGEWRLFPAVCGVTSAPTMRPDGSLVTEQGFDPQTGLLLVEPPPMPAVPDVPTKSDAEAALKLLEELLVGFPFVDDVARAGALSALITAVARGAFPVTPLHASRAPTAGSGKSFLWDIVAAIIIGHPMPVISTGKDEIEMEKRLGAALMTGQPLISIDNISGELGGDALCQIIERPVVDIRVLGQSKNMRIEARGTSLYATGNNFTLVGDVCRRVITINLDAGMERPELRQFDFDPIERVLADRGKYIAAALTICRAYFLAGRPDKAPKLASFEGWSDTVRSALIWLGKEDPVRSMELARQEDPELVELGEMLEAWSEVMGVGADSRAKLADVLVRCGAMSRESEDGELVPTYPRLNAALKVVGQRYLGKPALPDARLLGKWLQRFKGRPAGGKKFMNLPDPKNGAQWWVEGAQKAAEPQQPVNDPQKEGIDFNSAKRQRERS
ncbi:MULTISPECIES: bifunctional DNA primase/polymerase [unclassified Bradyrhizobium]|uniref:bifunctional DNA primase/polymerase n=1 Tax=unclassified Bradyrhizobium TaxID=2631580 RepID=UPI002479B375|nr:MULTISPECIES: bifunctional DNA primase/polymerase [unclassified Bradyrhizobium]WGR70196.1 bifunctional DNA primase/polymerase [Bradyrhizobium sp. ISRA426]WGR82253.1 bifunctional DNA primase/polymerase [Bradyrhizobium sp. ISRA430]WGR85439.1 bifunctional DNA primase/polymerase [Bradyrhizobium sp. ISRA432]